MGFRLLISFSFLALTLLVSHAATPLPPQVYWNSVLPNTPMPKSIGELVLNEVGPEFYKHDAYDPHPNQENLFHIYGFCFAPTNKLLEDPAQVLFFFENDLHRGTTMKYSLARIHKGRASFLPRETAQTIPFSSAKLPDILNKFSVKPESSEAHIIKQAVQACEGLVLKGEDRQCVTSLESMIDFATSKLGRNIRAIPTEVEKGATRLQNYTIASGVEKLADTGTDKLVLCHKMSYGYAVFYCHMFGTTIRAYEVPLQGSDGTNAKALAICHVDTSHWHPKSFALQALKIKPGTVPVCHFLPEGDIAWV